MFRKPFAEDTEFNEALDRGYANGGTKAALLEGAELLAARPEAAELMPFFITYMYAWAGEKDLTLDWIGEMYESRNPHLVATVYAPELDFVLNEPRHQEIVRRMNL